MYNMNVAHRISAGRRCAVGLEKRFASCLSVVRSPNDSTIHLHNPQHQQQNQAFSTGSTDSISPTASPQTLLSTAAKEAQRLSDLAAERRSPSTALSDNSVAISTSTPASYPTSNAISPTPSSLAISTAIDATTAFTNVEQQRRVQNAMDAAMALLVVTSRSTPLQDAVCSSTADTTVRKQVSCLHRAFLAVTSWCLDVFTTTTSNNNNNMNDDDMEILSQILQLARRAHELQLPFPLPMYQQLMVVVARHYHLSLDEPSLLPQSQQLEVLPTSSPPLLHNNNNQLLPLHLQLVEISTWISSNLGNRMSFALVKKPLMILADAKRWNELAFFGEALMEEHGIPEVDLDTTIELLVALGDEFPTDQQALRSLSPYSSKTNVPPNQRLLDVKEVLGLLEEDIVHIWLQAYDKKYFETEDGNDGFWDDMEESVAYEDGDFMSDDSDNDELDDEDEEDQQIIYTKEDLKGDGAWREEVQSYRESLDQEEQMSPISLDDDFDIENIKVEPLLPPLPSSEYYAAKASRSTSNDRFGGILPDVTGQLGDLLIERVGITFPKEFERHAVKSSASTGSTNQDAIVDEGKLLRFPDYPSAADAVQSANIAAKDKYGDLPDVTAQFKELNGGRGIDYYSEEFEREIVQMITSVNWKDDNSLFGDKASDNAADDWEEYDYDDDDDSDDDES